MVYSCTSETAGEFFHQRLRWISKGKAYIYPYNRWMQALVFLHLLAFYMLLWAGVCGNSYAIFAMILKYTADLFYGLRLKRLFNLHVLVIILMPFFQLYIFALLLVSPFIKPEWKKRKI